MYNRAGFGDLAPSLNFQKTSGATLFPDFRVGDSWQATITGPANQPVWLQSSRSGSPIILSQLGSTDSTGHFVLTGTVGQGDIGSWSETWYVGGVNISGITLSNAVNLGSISFVVSPAPSSQTGNTQAPVTPPPVPTSTGFVMPDLSAIPSWAWIAVAGIAAFTLLGGHRR